MQHCNKLSPCFETKQIKYTVGVKMQSVCKSERLFLCFLGIDQSSIAFIIRRCFESPPFSTSMIFQTDPGWFN